MQPRGSQTPLPPPAAGAAAGMVSSRESLASVCKPPRWKPPSSAPWSPHTCDRGAPLVVAGIGSPAPPGRRPLDAKAGAPGRELRGAGGAKPVAGPRVPGLRRRSGGRPWTGSGAVALGRAQSHPTLRLPRGPLARDPQSSGAPFALRGSRVRLSHSAFCASGPWAACASRVPPLRCLHSAKPAQGSCAFSGPCACGTPIFSPAFWEPHPEWVALGRLGATAPPSLGLWLLGVPLPGS